MRNNASFRINRAGAATSSIDARRIFNRLSLASAVTLALTASYTDDALATPKSWAEGRILVQTKAGLSDTELDKVLKSHNGKAIGHIRQINLHLVQVPPHAEEAVARALANNPHVKFAELDMQVEAEQIPNDPNYASAWHLPKIQAPTAWDSSQGNNVTIAILDTGVDASHPDLIGQLVTGWNSASGNADTADIYGHGTKVAGTAAATTNNGIGVAGVAGAARIMPVRVTNDPSGYAYWSSIANGLAWAADHGARVANISYEATGSSSIASAAQYLQGKGGVTVVAAGNSGADPGYSDSPYMISVSATASNDTKASWSNFGYFVDVAAPGVNIWTTTNGGSYGAVSGTSFSSPVTAGVVALMIAANPSLSPTVLEEILENTADDLGSAGRDTYYGYGRVNAAAAVQTAMQAQNIDNQAPSVTITAPSSNSTVAGIATVDVSATDDIGVTRVVLFANGTQVAEDTTSPFGFSWDTTTQTDGSATLVAYGYDAAGNQGLSQGVTVTVDNVPEPNVVDTTPPTVSIKNMGVRGKAMKFEINASDNVGVTLTSCFVDGQLLGASTTESLDCNWNINKLKGSFTISATAEDAAGNTSTTSMQVNL
ncbi:MAG: S8 family serine peptidase [Gammaproteobacteria bacterium]|nr:S8 family serine peptidase [Gammaproteobacteria bacterium]MCP5196767.1 S8 family serine peptidase [Gammaproteobacteria bacterium]